MLKKMSLIARRNWALRLSVVLNLCVLLYVCAHLTSSGPWIEESTGNWASPNIVPLAETYGSADNLPTNSSQKSHESAAAHSSISGPKTTRETSSTSGDKKKENLVISGKLTKPEVAAVSSGKPEVSAKGPEIPTGAAKNSLAPSRIADEMAKEKSILPAKEAIVCKEKSSEPRTAQRGDYWILYNYVTMSIDVKCWESVTYTTHADYTFLDNLVPLLERWQAPVSIALHAPGTDFKPTVESIKYARNCASPLVAQLVTFHVYFSSRHVPKSVPRSEKIMSESYNCSLGAPWKNVVASKMYKNEKKLPYPVNVGRNIARECAPTHYVLASDIELYPNPNLAPTFLDMIRRRDQDVLLKANPKVFVLSIFEVDEKSQPPTNKTALMAMLKAGTAIPFHKKLCPWCHNVPRSKEWQESPQSDALKVFHVGKRTGKFSHWEPIFIGTNSDPLYDERLSWEGKSDKMTQGYALCVLDYDFMILDNAFLVHRPGIKIYKKDARRDALSAKTNMLIKKIIVPELKILYGTRKGCTV